MIAIRTLRTWRWPRQRIGSTSGPDICDKSIPTPDYGLDVLRRRTVIAQCSTQQEDVLRKIRLFDESFRPDLLQQLVSRHKLAGVSDQQRENVGSFWSE